MPTGYTAAVADGTLTDFPTFALRCARGMGALIVMRDEPMDAPIPERFEPTPWYAEKLEAAKADVARYRAMNYETAAEACRVELQAKLAEYECNVEKNTAERNRYNAMLAKVMAWEPPTPDHEGFKRFMIEQIHESRKFDDYQPARPEPVPVPVWLAEKITEAERQIAYYTKEWTGEVDRAEKRTAWVAALRDSLKAREPA